MYDWQNWSDSTRTPARAKPILLFCIGTLWAILSNTGHTLERDGNRLLHDGEEVWLAGIDFQSVAVRPGVDEVAVLERLKLSGLNKIRIWAYPWFIKQTGAIPWARNTAGIVDLDRWNDSYWSTISNFVSAARQHGIIVEYTLFASKPSQSEWWASFDVAWNADFNVNGILASNAEGHAYPEFYQLNNPTRSKSGKRIVDYQQALVDKAIAELGGFDNLFFEVANEFPTDFQNRGYLAQSVSWILHWADYIAARTDRLVAVHAHDSSGPHTRGIDYYLNRTSIDILNFHFYTQPDMVAEVVSGLKKPANQILQSNESHAFFVSEAKLNETTQEAWAAYLSGLHYSFFFRDKDAAKMFEPGWETAIDRLATIHGVAKRFPVSGLSRTSNRKPIAKLLTHGPAANTSWLAASFNESAFIFYFWMDPVTGYFERLTSWFSALLTDHASVPVSLACGDYRYQWLDSRNGQVLREGTTESCPLAIPAPAPTGWSPDAGLVLILTKSQ